MQQLGTKEGDDRWTVQKGISHQDIPFYMMDMGICDSGFQEQQFTSKLRQDFLGRTNGFFILSLQGIVQNSQLIIQFHAQHGYSLLGILTL